MNQQMVTEHVLEVRYAAAGSFLNLHGYIADHIRSAGQFPHWKIDANIVHFFDTPLEVKRCGAFVAYNRAGFIVKDPDTQNFFQDKTTAFWKTLLENNRFRLPEPERFGVRTKIFINSDKPFGDINQSLYQQFFSPIARDAFGGTETDLSYFVKLDDGGFTLNIMVGPLHEGEAEKFLSFKSDRFRSTGMILDIDCFTTSQFTHTGVSGLLKDAMALTWSKADRIAKAAGL